MGEEFGVENSLRQIVISGSEQITMAQVLCPRCKKEFDSDNTESIVTRLGATIAGGVAGAWYGGGIGMVGGPLGGIAGTGPGAIFGGLAGFTLANQFRKCVHCSNIFRI
jgi:hypothetical protein